MRSQILAVPVGMTIFAGIAQAQPFPPNFQLADLLPGNGGDGSEGIVLQGADGAGLDVASAGDVNGDGLEDLIVAGESDAFVFFGRQAGFGATVDLTTLDGSDGFRIEGRHPHWRNAVAGGADFNGDGFDDVVLGAPLTGGVGAGATYVLFGRGAFPPVINVLDLDGDNGFTLVGADGDQSGFDVDAADINGDGLADVLIGSGGSSTPPGGHENGGVCYIFYGHDGPFSPTVDLTTLDGTNGFRILGQREHRIGRHIAPAGDVDGDGMTDILIAGHEFSPGIGSGYLVRSNPSGFPASIEAPGPAGFEITGGESVLALASAGDLDGDGLDDVAFGFDDEGFTYSAVVFGTSGAFPSRIRAPIDLDGELGFRLVPTGFGTRSGSAFSAGDLNGDGVDDLAIGAPQGAGTTDVVFGRTSGFPALFELGTLNGENGFRLHGIDADDRSGSALAPIGDFNNDGVGDLLIGATGAAEAYAVFGRSGCAADFDGDGDADVSDYFRFLQLLAAGDPRADIDGDGDLDADDFFAYLDLFAAGCE